MNYQDKDNNLLSAVTPRKSMLYSSLLLAGLLASGSAHAAVTLATGDVLTITAGVPTYSGGTSPVVTSVTGSYFGMDTNSDSKIELGELTMLSQGTTGLVLGITTAAGASHGGFPASGDSNEIDAPWAFFGNTGSSFLKAPATGSVSSGASAGGLNLSGWTVTWNGIPAINMGGSAWQPLNCSSAWMQCAGHTFTNGNAEVTWDGVPGDPYTLNYSATVPAGDPSGFGGVHYYLHLAGKVIVPQPLSCSNGSTCTVSPSAGFISTRIGGTDLTAAGIPADPDTAYYYPMHLYYDFTVQAGTGTANVVIPLSSPLPVNAVYRLYNANTSSWQTFVVDNFNSIQSAPGTVGGTCPVAGSTSYTTGLTQGNTCAELTILNGGADDTDSSGTTISDPGAIASTSTPVTSASVTLSPSGSSGCSISPKQVNPFKRSDWFLLLGFVAWLGFWRRKRHS